MKLAPLAFLAMMQITALVCARAQTSTTTTGTSSGATGGTTPGTTSGSGQPTSGVTGSPASAGRTRPIFLSGVVITDDGSPLPGSVNILGVCGASRRSMGHTSTAGDFGIQWANTTGVFADASETGRSTGGTGASSLTGSRNGNRGADPLANCELVAESAGYSSGRVSLYDRSGQDNYDVGTLILHRIAAEEGHMVSMLDLKAPKDARKSFGKGTSQALANKPADALLSFGKAVAIYPQYAGAWLGLGKVQWQLGRKDEAGASFHKSMDLDPKLVGSWQELGFLACDDARWEDAVRYLDQAVRLDPIDSPVSWYFSAVANYNLGRYDQAERSVRAELKLDRGRNRRADYLLGMVLIARRDLEGAAEALRNYIASAPKTEDVNPVRRELSRVESQLGR